MDEKTLNDLITQASNPDTAQSALLTLKDGVDALIKEQETSNAKIKEHETTIAGLRDTNQRLFLRITGKAETGAETPEKTVYDMKPGELDTYLREKLTIKEDGTNGD